MADKQGASLSSLQVNILILTVIVLLVVDLGLFLRMNQLQQRILTALEGGAAGPARSLPLGLEPGTTAPPFALEDADGTVVTLDQFQGSKVLVMFSSVSCSACEEIYPVVRRFYEDYHPSMEMLMISRGSSAEIRNLVEVEQITMPVLQWEDAVATAYRVPGIPFFFVIDEQGRVERADFAASFEDLEALVCSEGCEELRS